MKVFISWSGGRSRAVAELLSDWIKCVLQATRPWISTRDIDRGALWFAEISDQLKDTTVGIVCLTHENKSRPWILFEAGALAKGLSSNRVCTFLVDLKSTDLEDPLAQFNHTLPDQEGMWQLIKTLNISLGTSALDERILSQVFETYWPQFESKFKTCLKDNPQSEKAEPRSEKNLLTEILENTRFLGQKVRLLESRIERDSAREELLNSASAQSPLHLWKSFSEAKASGLLDDEFMRRWAINPSGLGSAIEQKTLLDRAKKGRKGLLSDPDNPA